VLHYVEELTPLTVHSGLSLYLLLLLMPVVRHFLAEYHQRRL